MPLARILTRYPEQATTLSEELRHHGYTVEFSSPGLTTKTPADLEIDFELCAEQDALSRASELAEKFDADVAVSPGALDLSEKRIAPAEAVVAERDRMAVNHASDETMALEPLAETHGTTPDTVEFPAAFKEAEVTLPANVLSEPAPEVDAHAMSAEPQQAVEPEWSDVSELPAGVPREPASAPVVQPWQQAHYESPVEEPIARANAALDDEINIAHAGVETREAAPERRNESMAEPQKSAATLHGAAVAGGELWAKTRDLSEGFWASARQVAAEYREGLRVRRAESRAERAHKLLELEKRRTMAEERAAELEAAREVAAARLQQLLRERGGLTQTQPVPPRRPAVAPVVASEPRTPITQRLGAFVQRVRTPLARAYRPQMEAALMGVAAACALFVLGLAVASFHAKPAISSSLNVPNAGASKANGVTVQTGGVTIKPTQPSSTNSASTAQTAASAPKPAVAKPAPGVTSAQRASDASGGSDVTVRHVSTRPSPRSGTNSDVVIRHFNAPAPPKPAQTPAQAGLKHISDLDN